MNYYINRYTSELLRNFNKMDYLLRGMKTSLEYTQTYTHTLHKHILNR